MCRTPLAHPKLKIKAESAEEAKAKFNEANGIRGSVHRYIVRADGTTD